MVCPPPNWSSSWSGKKERYNRVTLPQGGMEYVDIEDAFMKSLPTNVIVQVMLFCISAVLIKHFPIAYKGWGMDRGHGMVMGY